MNCKNCEDPLEENAQFCDNCGAKVVLNRITFKQLIVDLFINTFGVDSRFFLTLRKMTTHPDDVINEYLTGVRKRYVNPFAFLAIGAGLSLLIFNYYAEDFIRIQTNVNSYQIEELKEKAEKEIITTPETSKKELQKLQLEKKVAQMQLKFMDNMMKFMLKYYNLLTFVFLLFYTLLSKWTYWKPHNFGEHVIINAYISGFSTFVVLIAFFLAILVNPAIYIYSTLFYIAYYLYVFAKFYKHGFWQSILRLLKFLLGLVILFIVIMITVGIIGFILGKTGVIKV
ncbi:DUF3667 domain-containing protein [Polaribacter septentrionalilitoris]|uniref:DUF3667 domain-containing protein n=1 Tax=Polaribacter septentrionalilitoris TaxID=2494657 RepID=UPI00135B6EEE|nr:DUF3667 domain-containing protein [Polaribacter septentrionalilitoris]